jgi:hypothetical protein
MRTPALFAAVALLGLAATACSSGPEPVAKPPYTAETVKSGFIAPDEVAKDKMLQAPEPDYHNHTMYIPANAVPTCPYVERSDTPEVPVSMYVEPPGAEPTGKFLVQAKDYRDLTLPYVSQGALIFPSQQVAETAMAAAKEAHTQCPDSFEITGGPPEILGSYKVTSRPFSAHGWTGWSQHLVHTYPPHQDDSRYDDQVWIVVTKANAIVYVTYNQIMTIGDVAVGEREIDKILGQALARLG